MTGIIYTLDLGNRNNIIASNLYNLGHGFFIASGTSHLKKAPGTRFIAKLH
jgi:hypothetical protein